MAKVMAKMKSRLASSELLRDRLERFPLRRVLVLEHHTRGSAGCFCPAEVQVSDPSAQEKKQSPDPGRFTDAMALGDRIRALRKEAGWSQAELAQRIGVDAGSVSRYESGRITPSADALLRLAGHEQHGSQSYCESDHDLVAPLKERVRQFFASPNSASNALDRLPALSSCCLGA